MVERLVTYMYTLDYTREDHAAEVDVQMCEVADMLKVRELKKLAITKCTTHIGSWDERFL